MIDDRCTLDGMWSAVAADVFSGHQSERSNVSDDGSPAKSSKVDPRKKERARQLWERLANSRPGPDNKDLLFLARLVPLLSTAAVKTLLNRSVSVEELRELVQHVPKARDAAVTMLLKRIDELSEEDLRFIITQTKSRDAARILIRRNPGDAVLSFVERTVDDMKDIVEAVRKKEATSAVLREIDRLL